LQNWYPDQLVEGDEAKMDGTVTTAVTLTGTSDDDTPKITTTSWCIPLALVETNVASIDISFAQCHAAAAALNW
jgi:hypothetical protein